MATNIPAVDNTELTKMKVELRDALFLVAADAINALKPKGQIQFTKMIAVPPQEVQ